MPDFPIMTLTLVIIASLLIFFGSPMAVSLGFSAILVVGYFKPVPSPRIIPQLFSEAATSFILLAVPLFILVGNIMARGTVGRNLIDFTTSIVGWVPGGLGAVNIVGSMIFGGISGASLADTAPFGTILVPRMAEDGYPRDYAAAITLTSSSLSVVIPPSLLLVLAAAVTEQSVGRALAGGLLPGVLLTGLMLVPNHFLSVKHNYGTRIPFSLANVWSKFKTCWTAIVAPVIILGSIFSGYVTPTEGAAIAVIYVLIIDLLVFRTLGLRELWASLREAAVLTASILFIATSSAIASWIIAFEKLPDFLAAFLIDMPGGHYGFMVMMVILLILIGMVMDANPATLIFTPLFLPIAVKLGIDPTHFLVTVVMGLALGLTTPPYGVCLFSISTICKIPMERIVRQALPFYASMAVTLLLVAFFPEISLWVPRLIGI